MIELSLTGTSVLRTPPNNEQTIRKKIPHEEDDTPIKQASLYCRQGH